MISNKLTKTLSLTLFVFIFLILGSFTINKAQAQWVDAPGNPPGYGAASQWDYKPITRGLNNEYKTGNLGVGRGSADPNYVLYVGDGTSRGIRVIGDSFYEGNIGIGTENPTARLQIGDTTPNSGNQIVLGKYDTTSDSNLPVIQQKNIIVSGSSNDLALGARSTYGGVVLYTGATDISNVLGTNLSQPRLTVTNAGNVGIGTVTPNKKLHIYQDSGDNAEINLQSVGVPGDNQHWGIYNDRATNDLRFWQGDNILTIKENGNIGIGTTNPTNKLQVDGGIVANGLIQSIVDIRAPVFYDLDNTSYYIKPANVSNLNIVRTNEVRFTDGTTQATAAVGITVQTFDYSVGARGDATYNLGADWKFCALQSYIVDHGGVEWGIDYCNIKSGWTLSLRNNDSDGYTRCIAICFK